jgi:two-component system OmpR family sensor kinase
LVNLLDNAVKFSPSNGTIKLDIRIEDGDAVLSVSDAGPGIRQDEMPHLFERFYRGSAARSNSVPGVGLGLALSQAIAHTHGGRIEVTTPAGGGALFMLRLPLAD